MNKTNKTECCEKCKCVVHKNNNCGTWLCKNCPCHSVEAKEETEEKCTRGTYVNGACLHCENLTPKKDWREELKHTFAQYANHQKLGEPAYIIWLESFVEQAIQEALSAQKLRIREEIKGFVARLRGDLLGEKMDFENVNQIITERLYIELKETEGKSD